MVGPIGSGKSHLLHEWITVGTFQPESDKIYYFYQHYQSHYGLMSKEVENIEFKEGVDFEFIQNLHNTGTKYLLILDDSFGRFPALKILLKFQQLEDIKDSAQYISTQFRSSE